MSDLLESRLDGLEGHRDRIIDTLAKNGLDKLGEKELSLLEKTISNGAKIAIQRAQHALNTQSERGEEDYRRQATALLRAQREELNRRAQKAREEQQAADKGQGLGQPPRSLPEVPAANLGPNEGLVGQYQLDYDVLSGAKDFDPNSSKTVDDRDQDQKE